LAARYYWQECNAGKREPASLSDFPPVDSRMETMETMETMQFHAFNSKRNSILIMGAGRCSSGSSPRHTGGEGVAGVSV
jgi:hypothetical protein